jgi:predicted nucleic acid-binding Zn ribbon protein
MSARAPATLSEVLAQSQSLGGQGRISWWLWRDVVGERVASRSQPDRREGRTLWITVAASVWAQELSMLSPLILQRLQAKNVPVDALRFMVGQPRIPERPAPLTPAKPRELSAELQQKLRLLDSDPQLKAAIAHAASVWGVKRG